MYFDNGNFNEFGVKHPHECDCGCVTEPESMVLRKEVNELKELTSSIVDTLGLMANTMYRVVMMGNNSEKAEEKPKIITIEAYTDHINVIKPEEVDEEDAMLIIADVAKSFTLGE